MIDFFSDNYCKFWWDDVMCWNSTAPYTTVKSQCISWLLHDIPPKDAFVERKCLNGTWENISTRTLEMLYKDCEVIPSLSNNNTFEVCIIFF